MSRKVAIVEVANIKCDYTDNDFDDLYHIIAHSITEWQEVTEQEYTSLASHNLDRFKYRLIVWPEKSQDEIIANTVAAHLKEVKKRELAIEKIRAEMALEKKRAAKEKKLEKMSLEEKKKLFEALKKEFSEEDEQ
jgi:hypothetical protein